ncbi:phage holin family protein [Sedimentibacter sp.]|uniref:phage holin family protein n=1 Tax=Sedimentibacter sp. TaxID=1960295 RepID=UPI0028A88225|nr:phage holin family protein [Sedimentibacter sp.]
MSNISYQIATLVISLIGVILTGLVAPWLRTKLTNEKLTTIEMWVNIAVAAAEQIFKLPGSGTQKKMYVIEFLKTKGINITDRELDALIEAAVYEINRASELLFENLDNQDVEPG